MHEGEHGQEAPSNALYEQFSCDPPDLSSERGSGVQDQQDCVDQGTLSRRPLEVSPEHASEGNRIDQDTCSTAHYSVEHAGEYWTPVNTLAYTNFHRFQGECAGERRSKYPLSPLMPRRRDCMDSLRLKWHWRPSPTFTLLTKFVYRTSLQPLSSIHLQETIHIGSKARDLISRVDALEKCFDSSPSDVAEMKNRGEVILYAIICPTISSAEFPIASSRASRNYFARCARSQGRGNPLTRFSTAEICSNLSRIYERLYLTTRFAFHPGSLVDAQ